MPAYFIHFSPSFHDGDTKIRADILTLAAGGAQGGIIDDGDHPLKAPDIRDDFEDRLGTGLGTQFAAGAKTLIDDHWRVISVCVRPQHSAVI
jgi:hypothetical protein